MIKKAGQTTFIVDQLHFENNASQYLDVKIHIGYIELEMETTGQYSIESEKEIDLICSKLKEALKIAKRK